MAIPTKGARSIVVEGVPYRWYIRRKPTYVQDVWGGMTFALEPIADQPISTLIVYTFYDRPDSFRGDKAVIRPRDVAAAIRTAWDAGWQPFETIESFHLSMRVGTPIEET